MGSIDEREAQFEDQHELRIADVKKQREFASVL